MQKKKFFNFRVAFVFALCLCLGIAVVKNFVFGEIFKAVIFSAVAVLISLSVFLKSFNFVKWERIIIAFCCFIFFAFGAISFFVDYNNHSSQDLGGYRYKVSAKVVSATENDGGQSLILSKVVCNGNKKSNYKIRLYVYGDKGFDVGDLIEFNTLLKDLPTYYQGKFASSNVIDKIRYTASVSSEEISVCGNNLTIFEKANLFIRDTLKAGLDKNEFAVGYALLTGNSKLMDTEVISAYRMAGVAHVFAVSGLHIGFLATVLSFIFDKLKCRRVIKSIIIPLILFCYSGVCAFTPSSLRATIMTSVALLLSIKGMRYDRLTAISLAAVLILAFAPVNLFDAGFQLSFVVVIGITLFAPTLARWLNRVKYMPKKLASALSVALAAQLASMPIYLFHFKSVSLIAVFLNVIFIPAVSVIFTMVFVLTLVGRVFAIPKIALFVPNYVLKFINVCITAVDFEVFILHGVITLLFVFSFYWALLFMSEYFNLKSLTRAICSIVCLIFTLTGCVIYNISAEQNYKIYVCANNNLCVTIVDTTEENVMFVSYANRNYSIGNLISLKNEGNIDQIDSVIFLDGFGFREQEFLTKMRLAFSFSGVYCFGESDEITEKVIKKSFGKNIVVGFYNDGQSLPVLGAECEYALNGRAVEINFLDKSVCVLAEVDGVDYTLLNGDYDMMIAKDRVEQLSSFYSPKIFVSYLDFVGYLNAESNGRLLFEYKNKA